MKHPTPTWLRIGTYLAIGWGLQLAATATAGYAVWIALACIAGAIATPLLLRAGIMRACAAFGWLPSRDAAARAPATTSSTMHPSSVVT